MDGDIAYYHGGSYSKRWVGGEERKENQNVMDKLMLRAAVASDRDLLSHTTYSPWSRDGHTRRRQELLSRGPLVADGMTFTTFRKTRYANERLSRPLELWQVTTFAREVPCARLRRPPPSPLGTFIKKSPLSFFLLFLRFSSSQMWGNINQIMPTSTQPPLCLAHSPRRIFHNFSNHL